MKQIQDAYIVAATRTPIGRRKKATFRNTRPDDLLALRCIAAWLRCRADPAAIEDDLWLRHPRRCAGPERGAHWRGAGGPAQECGRHHRQPLLRLGLVGRARWQPTASAWARPM